MYCLPRKNFLDLASNFDNNTRSIHTLINYHYYIMHYYLEQATFLLLSTSCEALLLPPPPGPYNVSLSTGVITDYSRVDPWASTPQPRSIVVSIFQPAACSQTVAVPYMPSPEGDLQTQFAAGLGWPANLSFSDLQLPVCPPDACETSEVGPIVPAFPLQDGHEG